MANFTSWLSQSSWERRQAWAKQSCTRHSVVVEEEMPNASPAAPELQPAYLEQGFLQGSPSNEIESWLEECSSSAEPFSEGISAPTACATLLLDKERAEPRSPKGISCSYQHLNLDHSLASSALSGSTNKTSSSISEVLERCEVDAETILYNLGFIQEETKEAPWIPARFFSLPSQARGIDYQLFLRSQVKRLEMEDPCLMLASRFKQVQTMAVTADALFCLYSYVSKTPVQKISPAHLFWDFPHIPDSWNIPSEPEALSPLQRLRNAISRMCLYTSPREEGLPVASDMQSPMSRLERIVWEVMGKIRQDKLHLDAESVQHNAHTGPLGGLFSQRKMESTSSETTIPETASVTSPCFCCEAPSQPGERTEPILPELESWLSRCTDGVSIEWPGHLGYPERYCYGQYSAQEASSPDESSEESEEDWPTRKGSTTGEEDRMDTLTKLV
ncbi:protein TESPA1 isoform X2 [Hemicordylus capensis]|uniref:protein TESPA1 isoform X2 n=1 Tax=Hemicordylus capensis TaxID=884348 RepID=UPI0023023991|nr:protein TESPA1 isoform X2 [Hemicordylus capensis]